MDTTVYFTDSAWTRKREFGARCEFERYVKEVGGLGSFPLLSGLLEPSALEDEHEPDAIAGECDRLMLRGDVSPWTLKKTKVIRDCAECALAEGLGVRVCFEEASGDI